MVGSEYSMDIYKAVKISIGREMKNPEKESVPDLYKNKQMCDEAVDTYRSTIDCYNTQEMCDKAINRCFLAFAYIPD